MEFLAKSNPVETLKEHTDRVLACLEVLFRIYGHLFTEKEKRLLRIACQYHDYGKIEKIFQQIVHGTRLRMEIPHGFLSGLFLWEDATQSGLLNDFSDAEIRAIYTAIHYHHTRIDDKDEIYYKDYAQENLQENYKIFTGHEYKTSSFRYLRKRLFVNDPAATLKVIDEEAYLVYLLIKGILNKADYAASGHVDIEIESTERLTEKVVSRFGNQLRPAQCFMRDHRNENIIAIAPTGSGKTEGVILWLDDAKGLYTLPLKVSAGAIFHRIHDSPLNNYSSGYGFQKVGLLHSDSIFEYIQCGNNESAQESNAQLDRRTLAEYQSVRSLAYPLTITTVDQLFKFVFKALGTELFAATLKYSRVIIDEMQMYEPKILAMLIYGLKTISLMGGKFAIITATLPDFVRRKLEQEHIPFAYHVFPGNERRHIVHLQSDEFADSFDLDAIGEAAKTQRVLVICNTVRRAQELKRELPQAHLLHSRFIKMEREILEKGIIDFQDNCKNPNSTGIWISTQLVEASLDIDFDVLHTELCTADSLLQRFGRCWRSRTYLLSSPNVFIYDHGSCGIYDPDIFKRSKEFLGQYEDRIFTECEKLDYVNAVFDEGEIAESAYYKTFQASWSSVMAISPTKYSKEDADEQFRDIQSKTVIPDSVYETYREEIEEYISIINDKNIAIEDRYGARQKLDRLTLSIGRFSGDSKFVDRTPIQGTDIYRTRAVYSSIDDGGIFPAGLGLLREERDNDNML